MAISITRWRVNAVLSRRRGDVDEEPGFFLLNLESSKNRTEYEWPLVGDIGDLVRAPLVQIERDGLTRARDSRALSSQWQAHPIRNSAQQPETSHGAAGYPRKLMHDFRRTAATRMDSTPGISISVSMNLLGHKNDTMFRRYAQKHGDRLVEAAAHLAKRPKELWVQDGNRYGHR